MIDRILELVEANGRRCLFLISCGTYAFRLLDRLRPLSESALSIVPCGPMEAEALKRVVSLRHGSAGMKFELGDRHEEQLSQWALARLFSRHFDYAGGVVGVALRGWVASIREVQGSQIVIEAPERRGWEVLDDLRSEWIALLLQLALRKQVSFDALRRMTGLDEAVLQRDTAALRRMGLIVRDRDGVFELDAFVQQAFCQRMVKRGVLA